MVSKAHNGNIGEMFLGKTSMSNFDQCLQDKMWTLRLDRAHVPVRPLETRRKMVLCIDDNEDILDCENAFLEFFGYGVLIAPSGGEGLELASIYSVDVVIVDYFMPEMSGHELAIDNEAAQTTSANYHAIRSRGRSRAGSEVCRRFRSQDRLASELLPAIAQLQGC